MYSTTPDPILAGTAGAPPLPSTSSSTNTSATGGAGADDEAVRRLSQRLTIIWDRYPHLRPAAVTLYAPMLPPAFVASSSTSSSSSNGKSLSSTSGASPADSCASAATTTSSSPPEPNAGVTLHHVRELLALLHSPSPLPGDSSSPTSTTSGATSSPTDPNAVPRPNSPPKSAWETTLSAHTNDPHLPAALAYLHRLLDLLGASTVLTEVPSMVTAIKQGLSQAVWVPKLPEMDSIIARCHGWLASSANNAAAVVAAHEPPSHQPLTSTMWSKVTQEIDSLASIPASAMAVVQQRGWAMKDASTNALSRVYDDARYVWGVNEDSVPIRVRDLGLLLLSNLLLTISMATWSAAVLCTNETGQPARA